MKLLAHSLSLAALLGISSVAHADLFNFSYTLPFGSGSVSATGQFTTDPLTGNYYLVTGITGTRTVNGVTANITGLLPVNSFGGNDNKLFPSDPYVTGLGISYTIDQNDPASSGNINRVNFYHSNGGYTEFNRTGFTPTITVTPASAAVPEPGSIALLVGAGIGGIVLRRRNRK